MNGRHLAALLLVPALALTACGGDGDPEPTASAQTFSETPSAAPSGASGGDQDGSPGGGGDGGAGGATPAPPSTVPSHLVNAFFECMRKHGVKVPDDGENWRPDPEDGRTQKALMACIDQSGAPGS